ncbi:MAG: hypothetical protein VB858_16245 [Planctomycetaceae bacterium]
MFSPTVSIGLIAAVIACPVWCGGGVCHTEACHRQAVSAASDLYAVHGADGPCCTADSRSGNDRSGNDQPQPCPCGSQSSCQGICGGAVLGKAIGFNSLADVLVLPLNDAHAPVTARMVTCSHLCDGPHHRDSSSNHGRRMRTLHMSFLC